MEKLQQQALGGQPVDASPRKVRRLSPKTRDARQSTYPSPIERSRRPEHRSGSLKILGRSQTRFTPPPSEREPVRESSESSEVGSTPPRNHKEPKRPSLACTFCRERKIACDRWAEGGIDSDAPCTYVRLVSIPYFATLPQRLGHVLSARLIASSYTRPPTYKGPPK